MKNEIEEIDFYQLANFFPKQKEAFKAIQKFKYLLYGGSVGSGKSRWLRWSTIGLLLQFYGKYDIKGIRAGLFCEDYPSLNDRHLSKVRYEFPDWLGTWNESKHEFTLHPQYGSGVLAFRNLDDISKYLSVEFAIIAVDEINRNPKPVFDMLRSRLRWPHIRDTKFIAACNPLGEAWVKNLWVKRLFPPDEKEQYEFVYIPALPTDNPHLPEEYFKSLESLPENQRKAYLEGNWDAFDEGMDEKGYVRLVSDRELQAAFVGDYEHSGYKILGVDPAAGGDNSAIVLKSGNLQEIVFNRKLANTMDLVGVIIGEYKNCHADLLVIDKNGLGQGVYDRIQELDFNIRGVSFGEKSEDPMFANLKAEWHWREREWIVGGGKLMRDDGWNEFEYVRYKNKDGKIIIQPKEELFKEGLSSPNCIDAAVLTMAIKDTAIKSAYKRRMVAGREFYDKMNDVWNNEPTKSIEIFG